MGNFDSQFVQKREDNQSYLANWLVRFSNSPKIVRKLGILNGKKMNLKLKLFYPMEFMA